MKKEAIIDLIKGDLEEIGTLVETFREPDRIAKDFIDLLREKCEGINREIALLNYWSTENLPETKTSLVADIQTPRKAVKQEPKHEEVPDYFAHELETMPDPLEAKPTDSIKLSFADDGTEQTPDEEAEPAVEIEITGTFAEEEEEEAEPEPIVEPAPVVKVEPKPTPKPEPKPAPAPAPAPNPAPKPTPKPEPKPAPAPAPKKREQPAPQAKITHSNAADIANYGTPVSDVNRAIGINDRFLYQRELFNGNKTAMDEAIAAINLASSYNQAYLFLKQSYNWDETDSTVEAFLKAVHRRFL